CERGCGGSYESERAFVADPISVDSGLEAAGNLVRDDQIERLVRGQRTIAALDGRRAGQRLAQCRGEIARSDVDASRSAVHMLECAATQEPVGESAAECAALQHGVRS